MSASPTARSLAWCRARGWPCGVVERWNPHAKVRHDLLGFIDLLAVAPPLPPSPESPAAPALGGGILAVQATAGSCVAARMAKIDAEPRAIAWLKAGGWLEVWGWRKTGKAGKAKRWSLRRIAGLLVGDGAGGGTIRWVELP